MIDRREILEAASSFSLLPNIVEKDYVLGPQKKPGCTSRTANGSDFTIFATHSATGW
jgi:hypothetical protein